MNLIQYINICTIITYNSCATIVDNSGTGPRGIKREKNNNMG